MRFVNREHLGGFVAADERYPNGDPMTYTPEVWEYLLQRYRPSFVCDVGCGEGHAVKWFNDRMNKIAQSEEGKDWPDGLLIAVGIEGCAEAIEKKVHKNVRQYDFTVGPIPLEIGGFGLVWSCEFVEHVESKYMDNFLNLFDRSDVVAMTHAFPGQPGHHHVNCQPAEYWIDVMKARGFTLNHIATAEARAVADESHWKRSGLVFEKVNYVPKFPK